MPLDTYRRRRNFSRTPEPRGTSRKRNTSPVIVAGVTITHPARVLYPEQNLTKLDLIRYYVAVADFAVPLMKDRPLTLLRCPAGRDSGCFFQKHIGKGTPAVVPRINVNADEEPYAMVDSIEALVALVQLGVLEFHVWGSRADDLDRPDIIVFDLYPAEGVAWNRVVDAAHQLRETIERLDLVPFVRLTGGKGLHIVVPIVPGPSWQEVRLFSKSVAEYIVGTNPEGFTARMAKRVRTGKIFIDYIRNSRESTAIASYSTRAKTGAPVALPIAWEELDEQVDRAPSYAASEVPDIVATRTRDPWHDFERARRKLKIRDAPRS